MKIAIVGRIRSGKDTFAEYFMERGFKKAAFGDGIRSVIQTYFPEALEEGKPRLHYQVIGQAFRQLDPEVWIKLLQNRLNVMEELYGHKNIIVTDLRQLNEYQALKAAGFTIVKVEAAEEIRIERMKAAGDRFELSYLNHETEQYVDSVPYDYLVSNNGTLQDLLDQARHIYEEMREADGRC